jgi:hypothetical protein
MAAAPALEDYEKKIGPSSASTLTRPVAFRKFGMRTVSNASGDWENETQRTFALHKFSSGSSVHMRCAARALRHAGETGWRF